MLVCKQKNWNGKSSSSTLDRECPTDVLYLGLATWKKKMAWAMKHLKG